VRAGDAVNRVRFVFFGAEELGLLGSYAYVASLNSTNTLGHALDKVVGALDHDMFGNVYHSYMNFMPTP
jgi:Zn-dependent M28 family amino/carboxypeptidase